MNRIQDTMEQAQIGIGYTVAAGLTTAPVWVQKLTDWFDLLLLVIGVAVGLTTLWINIQRIRRGKK